jgi:hypothetical protein
MWISALQQQRGKLLAGSEWKKDAPVTKIQ